MLRNESLTNIQRTEWINIEQQIKPKPPWIEAKIQTDDQLKIKIKKNDQVTARETAMKMIEGNQQRIQIYTDGSKADNGRVGQLSTFQSET